MPTSHMVSIFLAFGYFQKIFEAVFKLLIYVSCGNTKEIMCMVFPLNNT